MKRELTDLSAWADWNPHAVRASGVLALGERLDLRLKTGRGGMPAVEQPAAAAQRR